MSIIMSGVSMSMLKESERLKQMERHSMMKESERLKQMGKEIHQVEYNGWNNQNKTNHKSFEEKMFDAYIIREGYSETKAKDMTKEENANKWRKWNIVFRQISLFMFRDIAFELCLNGNFSCDGDRNVKHLIQELSRVDSDVQDYEWDLSKNDFSI
jgi:hypothetical protein